MAQPERIRIVLAIALTKLPKQSVFLSALCFLISTLLLSTSSLAGNPVNPILFVTQVPIPEEVNGRDITQNFMSIVSPFANHLADTAHAGRGGSLHIRFNNGQVVDLLAVADWSAIPGGKPAADAMAVRNPAVHFSGSKAIFSMTYGKPSGPSDPTVYRFQLYEITLPTQAQLNASTPVKPALSLVPNQPPYNNVSPAYAPGGKIVFTSDRPYNGQPHLAQREEYLSLPTVSGVWALDPANATSLRLLHHSPSGAFTPTVDSAGRVIFTNWDHLSRDVQAVFDSRDPVTTAPYNETFTRTFNGSGNFDDESASASFTQVTSMAPNTWDTFPEPRNFDRKTLLDLYPNVNGNAFNLFLPWMVNLDGTGVEILNHVGRHEIGSAFTRSFTNDSNLLDLNPATAPSSTNGNWGVHNFFQDFYAPKEDPLNPGIFFGADGPDLGTHAAGRIVRLAGGTVGANPDNMAVTYLTKDAGAPPTQAGMNFPPQLCSGVPCIPPSAAPLDLYRTPVPLSDGNLIASHVAVRQTDYNTGTVANPVPVAGYSFRLRSLQPPVSPAVYYANDVTLTPGINITVTYWAGGTQVSYSGQAWELDPVEVVARGVPPVSGATPVHAVTAAQFVASNVHLPTFQSYLAANNAALAVSFDVTKRDRHDKQQPYNLRVSWSGHQTTGTGASSGLYDIAWQRFYQADLRRGYLAGAASPQPGRRVVATPMHDTTAMNVQTAGAPAGAVKIGDDGSVAAIVPAGKAMTWELLNNDVAKTSQVKERFWVTFQPGEVRTCANCHGINTADQAGAPPLSNMPAAPADLLTYWKSTHPAGVMQFASNVSSVLKNAGTVVINVLRSGGSTGPVSVNYATANGTALAGTDYVSANGTLNWADGDTAAKAVTVALLNNPVITGSKTFSLALTSPAYGSLGATAGNTVTIAEPVPPAATLDADGDSSYRAASDGLLIMRYLLGTGGAPLTANASLPAAMRKLPLDVSLYLAGMASALDINGDGIADANDGMLAMRYLLGFRGTALTAGIPAGSRNTAQIEIYLQSLTP